MARRYAGEALTSIHHFMDEAWLREAFYRVRRDSATGVDGVTVQSYGENLEEHLPLLLERVKTGRYTAPPVRRGYIPKDGKEMREIGMPTTEDKVLQRAGVMLLEPIYEESFSDFSFGFRPGRSQHQALQYLRDQAMRIRVRWILDVDIRKFFDTIDHGHLREVLHRRVRDGVVTKLIDKWLKAGVMEEDRLFYPEEGSPQGGVISPMLSNILLDEVLDKWYERDVKGRLRGRSFVVRYADDFVMGFEHKEDAERVLRVLPKRFGKYGLMIHPEKTKLVPFHRPPRRQTEGTDKPGTFDFLGFTHYWGRSRRGNWVIQRKTATSRFSRSLKRISEWCRENRHLKLREQHRQLKLKVRGHYGYYGITGNYDALRRYRRAVERVWHKWLSKRSRDGPIPWERFRRVLDHYCLPAPRVVHSIYVAKP